MIQYSELLIHNWTTKLHGLDVLPVELVSYPQTRVHVSIGNSLAFTRIARRLVGIHGVAEVGGRGWSSYLKSYSWKSRTTVTCRVTHPLGHSLDAREIQEPVHGT